MVTVRGPMKGEVSIRATIAVSSPGLREFFSTEAVTQPQETRRLLMLTGFRVLLTTRKWWTRLVPRGVEPKSLLNSSNSVSAHVAALAGAEAPSPTRRTRLYR